MPLSPSEGEGWDGGTACCIRPTKQPTPTLALPLEGHKR